ncbi:MAG: Chaperone SurA [Holosporales bacterium]
MRKLACIFMVSVLVSPVFSYEAKIAVVVDKKAITETDVESRTSLMLFFTRQENTAANRQRAKQQAYDMLVMEQLQIKEAAARLKKEGKVKEQEIDHYIASLAQQNNMTADQFKQMLKDVACKDCVQHTDIYQSFRNQIKAQIAWSKLLEYAGGYVSDCEVNEEMQKINQAEGSLYDILELVLYANNPNEKGGLKKQAQDYMDQIKKGASFSTLAQQFSQSSTAKEGGKVGRQKITQFDSAIRTALVQMNIADMRIVETAKGIHLIQLKNIAQNNDKSEKIVSFKIAVAQVNPEMTDIEHAHFESMLNSFDEAKSVDGFLKIAKDHDLTVQSVDDVPINQGESEEFKKVLQDAKVGDVIKAGNPESGIQIIYIAKKGIRENKPMTRQDVKRLLSARKRNDFGVMLLNKLRARTFVEHRKEK